MVGIELLLIVQRRRAIKAVSLSVDLLCQMRKLRNAPAREVTLVQEKGPENDCVSGPKVEKHTGI